MLQGSESTSSSLPHIRAPLVSKVSYKFSKYYATTFKAVDIREAVKPHMVSIQTHYSLIHTGILDKR